MSGDHSPPSCAKIQVVWNFIATSSIRKYGVLHGHSVNSVITSLNLLLEQKITFNAVIKICITYSRHISILHKQWLKDTEHPKKQWKKSVVSVKKRDFTPFNVHGSVHRKNILIYIQQDATLHSIFYLETALHVSGGTSTHHQECKQLYLQHLVFVTLLLLPAAIMEELELVWVCSQHSTDMVVCTPDDGWRYYPKYVQQFPDKINCVNLKVASLCIIIQFK
jgi:hypothetical protein